MFFTSLSLGLPCNTVKISSEEAAQSWKISSSRKDPTGLGVQEKETPLGNWETDDGVRKAVLLVAVEVCLKALLNIVRIFCLQSLFMWDVAYVAEL
jgi:hypothetical protein